MRDLIRRILKEEQITYNTLEMIRDYSGNNEVLNDLKRKLKLKGGLTDNQIQGAVKAFKSEYWSDTIYSKIISYNSPLKNLVTSLGIQTYDAMVRTDKKYLFMQKSDSDNKIVVGEPNPEWVNRNVTDLEFFKSHIVDSGKKFKFPGREGRHTITQEIDYLFILLKKNDFQGFIENGEWSILNKLGSNWSNWAKMISIRERSGVLGDKNAESKIEEYFKQRPIDNINDVELSPMKLRMARTISYADLDLAKAFKEVDENFQSSELEKIKNRIKSTTEKGESVERDFISWLEKNGVTEIRNFSSFGNVVDITFSVDLIAKLNGVWVPIQVKSSEKSARDSQIHSFDIGGIAVYSAPKKLQCGNWVYYTSKKGFKNQGSFDEDFLNIQCERNDYED